MPRILYAASSELVTYAADRGVVVSEDEARIQLNKAQDYIDNEYEYIGEPMQDDSQFPRTGTQFADDVVPYAVQNATLYAALMLLQGVEFMEGKLAESQQKSVKIAVSGITEEFATNYKDGAIQDSYRLDAVTVMLRRANLLDDSMASLNMRGVRG